MPILSSSPPADRRVDVIVPVYRGLAITRRCLESVLAAPQQTAYTLTVIEDASPEPALSTYLDGLAAAGQLNLLRNPANLGFVKTANRGLQLHPDRDVVLLNSDTEVSGDWLDRLRRCAYADPDTGTVTPFSNNATICSYPRLCESNELPPGLTLAELDALFARANAGERVVIPTGVGFCFYIRRDCLDAVGYLDEERFGLGYGEENDFCLRAERLGWRSVLCADTYVYHVGGVSFSERQQALQQQAIQTLLTLYPDYTARIMAFIAADPMRPLRYAVDQARAALSAEQAVQVLAEREASNTRLAQELQHSRAHNATLERALSEAQMYVRAREADIAALTRGRAVTPAAAFSGDSKTMHLFTSIAANYLPKARVLARSAKRHLPQAQFHIMLCDPLPAGFDLSAEPFDSVIPIHELPIPDLDIWTFKHSVVELCTAVKGQAFLEIARRYNVTDGKIFYFDPDMVIFSDLAELIAELDQHNVILTPHITVPEDNLGAVLDNEIGSLKYGVYNLGFLGVRTSAEGLRFLNWWSERLLHYCYDDIAGGLFTDQRWIDLAPVFFEGVGILRGSQYNVATWNLTHRHAAGSLQDGVTINGVPLGFYHFSGFDSGAQEIMLKKYGQNSPVLFELRDWYIEQCERAGQSSQGRVPCRFATYDNGEPITKLQRIIYRSRLDLERAFPTPYATDDPKKSYYHWFQTNVGVGAEFDHLPEAALRSRLADAARELELIKRSRRWRLAGLFARAYHAFR